MKKKIFTILTAAALFAVSMTACGSASSDGSRTSSAQAAGSVNSAGAASAETASSSNQTVSTAEITPSVPSPAAQQNSQNASGNGEITEDQAKQIAFDNAQVKESDLLNLQIKKDLEDGISIYEIEFQSGNKKYEYDIKASDGQILKTDYEIDEDYVEPGTQTGISEADAKAAALAKVPGASDSNIQIRLEREDGRLVYEGKIIYDNLEYEFEIDADSGSFLKWEQDSVFD